MCEHFACIYVCVSSAHGGQKRVVGALGTGVMDGSELYTKIQILGLWKSNL